MKLSTILGAILVLALPIHAQGTATEFGYSGCYDQRIGAQSGNILLAADSQVRVNGASRLFIRVLADTPRSLSGFDLPIALVSGADAVVDAFLYSADTNDRPGAVLRRGSMGLTTAQHWRRTVFHPEYRTTAGQFYFLAIDVPAAGVRIDATTSSNRRHVSYFVRPQGGSLGAMQVAGLVYKVNTDGTQPRISSVTPPTLGTNWHVRCNNVPNGGLEFLVLSVGEAPSFRGLPAGNFLYGSYCCQLDTIGRGGTADYVFALPNHPSLAGLSLTVQWDIATGANLVDPTFSNALAVVLR